MSPGSHACLQLHPTRPTRRVGGLSSCVGRICLVVGRGPLDIAVGDVNNDSKPDLVTANRDSKDVTVLLGDGRGGFEALR